MRNVRKIEGLTRRDVLKATGIGAGALVLGVHVSPKAVFADDAPARFEPNVFVSIDEDGTVWAVAHRSEMGQGIRTALPAVLADELEADWERVKIVQADGDEKYVNQNTDGSRSVRTFFDKMRETGATARHMLVLAAAAEWGVEAAECVARGHAVHHQASGKSLGYGELVSRAAALQVPDASEVKLKPPSEWRYIGKPLKIVDADAMTTGEAVYGADVDLPDMLYASVEHCPVVGGEPKGWDAAAALAVKGVTKVTKLDTKGGLGGGFQPICGVAVLADNTWAAFEGRKALKVEWNPGPHAVYNSPEYKKELEATAAKKGRVVRETGDVEAAFAGAAKTIEASYYVPHLAQAPMEPPCAVAQLEDGRLEVWAPSQDPIGARQLLAQTLGLEVQDVTVHVTLLGGGFGRKSKPDFVIEAALLAKETDGRPVKLTWKREDDIRTGYYHAVSSQYLKGALDAAGKPVAWLQRSVFPSIGATFNAETKQASAGELGLGLVDLPFALPHLCLENGEAEAHVRIGWMRSVANIYHAFATGSFADELAHAAGRDPKDFLLELIGPPRKIELGEGVEYGNYGEPLERFPIDTGRLRKVIEVAAKSAGWGKAMPKGRALGISAHRTFLTYVAIVVDAEVDKDGKLVVHEVHCAVDCGVAVNPDRVKAQMEGGIVYGLTIAFHGAVTAKDGAIVESNFHDYPVLRMRETPKTIAVHIVESTEPPAGVGEPGTPPVAPALTNAIFAATGKRVRELPLAGQGYV